MAERLTFRNLAAVKTTTFCMWTPHYLHMAVFAISMLVQFMNYFLANAAELREEPGRPEWPGGLEG